LPAHQEFEIGALARLKNHRAPDLACLRHVCARLRINDAPDRPLEQKPNFVHIKRGGREVAA